MIDRPLIDSWYHLWIGPNNPSQANLWQMPFIEHLAALSNSVFTGNVFINVVNADDPTFDLIDRISVYVPNRTLLRTPNTGSIQWEQETLDKLHAHAQTTENDILYAHNKAGMDDRPIQRMWRRAMCNHLVSEWRDAQLLLQGHDAVGIHWFAQPDGSAHRHFSGNYFMATAQYIRTLNPCVRSNRHEAEIWLGLNDPDVVDLFPGGPNVEAYCKDGIVKA